MTLEEPLVAAASAQPGRRRPWPPAVAAALGAVAVVAGAVLLVSASRATPGVETVRPGREVPVTPMDQALGPANNSPLLVADPTDSRFVVLASRMDAPDFSCALHVSGDRGRSWAPATPVAALPPGADKCYAPEVAFDDEGRLYYLFVGLAGFGNEPMGVFLTTSTDRAATFSPPRQVLGPLNFGVRMAIDRSTGSQGRLHLVWLQATSDPSLGGFGPPPNPIMTAHSDDRGETFSDPVQVSDPHRPRAVAPALALGPDHHVHVAYVDLVDDFRDYQGLEGPVWDGTWSLVLASSTDGGRRFSPGVVVDDGLVPAERPMLIFTMPPPSLVADGSRVCFAWSDARRGDSDVFVRCVVDGERPQGEPTRVNDDRVGNGRTQYLPRLALSGDGRLDAVFYDRRNSPENVVNEVFFTYSTDRGRRFAPNLVLTGEGSDARIGQQYANVSAEGQVEWGARLGLLSEAGRAVATWADTRNSRPNTTGQDLFLTTVDVVHRSRSWWPLVQGAVLLAAGVVGVAASVARRRRRPEAGAS